VIEIRTPTAEDWPAMVRADGRAFSISYSAEDIERIRTMVDLDRFRVAFEGSAVVAVAGSYEFDMTVPGGRAIPTGGVTWVSVAVSHRRQGLLRRLMDAVHDDIDARGEPLAALTASEGGIYERFGYGIASRTRISRLDRRFVQLRPEHVPAPGTVRMVDPLQSLEEIAAVWDRYRLTRPGEISQPESWWRVHAAELGDAAIHVLHADGYACWTSTPHWDDGHPAHELTVVVLAAVTPAAHRALWHTVLSTDLAGPIRSRRVVLDDPLPWLLTNQRALRTTDLNDGVWCNVRDVVGCFGARTYGTDDELVVEAEGRRWKIGGGGVARTRSRPDLVAAPSSLGALLLGGEVPTTLAAGGRVEARNAEALRRADALFVTHPGPSCQIGF
jgi:predicted acetyltransferase